MALRLKTLAKLINQRVPGVRATIKPGYCNTDRKSRGCRYITHVGKGRRGNRLVVRRVQAPYEVLLDHNAAETYRSNSEAMAKVEKLFGPLWEQR
jgi:hypothetical protein